MSEPAALFPPLKPRQIAPRLWRGGRFVTDAWRILADGEAAPPTGHVVLSLDRWRSERASLLAARIPIGIALPVHTSIDAIADDLPRLDLVTLPFPKFSDGRAYSTARRQREAGFTGELRATGDVLVDQIPLMLRAGLDAFEITNASAIAALESHPLPAVSRVYQAGQEASGVRWQNRRNVGAR